MTTGQELVTVERPALTVFGTDEPVGIVARVTAIAGPLADFIKQQHMSTQISGREYVLAEGWSFMGAMLGVAPVTRRVSEVRDSEGVLVGFEAQVELVAKDGAIVGGAVGECSWAEKNWSDRDPFALKSMAQTRATGKAYRMAFGFVMKAAGYEATPAEEMPLDGDVMPAQRRQPTPPHPRQRLSQQPAWALELKTAMEGAEVTWDDIGKVLDTRPTTQAVQDWLTTNKATPEDLVALAIPSTVEAPF